MKKEGYNEERGEKANNIVAEQLSFLEFHRELVNKALDIRKSILNYHSKELSNTNYDGILYKTLLLWQKSNNLPEKKNKLQLLQDQHDKQNKNIESLRQAINDKETGKQQAINNLQTEIGYDEAHLASLQQQKTELGNLIKQLPTDIEQLAQEENKWFEEFKKNLMLKYQQLS